MGSSSEAMTKQCRSHLNQWRCAHSIINRSNAGTALLQYHDSLYGRWIQATIERGFASGWDKVFAHPTQPWTLPKSKTNNFENHERFTTIQTIVEEVFFETEQRIILCHLMGALTGMSWKNTVLHISMITTLREQIKQLGGCAYKQEDYRLQ